MGKVKVPVLLTNYVDKKNAEQGIITEKDIKKSEVNMLVDTGATMIVIGEDLAEKLGIQKEEEVYLKLADDSIQKRYKGHGLLVNYHDRSCLTGCIILEKGVEPLLGQIPLEEMDLVVDCNNKRLIPNPQSIGGKVVLSAKFAQTRRKK